ncbi:MAG TPA: M20/M25/M40 family metallo-hydrolase [Armatimonadetes bacterium]|nr:M20/M25/M40 family metallo-hydrolase [Armatimonadota bacterium]
MDKLDQVIARVEDLAEETISLCQRLVRTNTVNRYSGDAQPGNEAEGQAVLEPLLRELGAKVEKFDCPPDIYERMGILGPPGRDFSGRPNLVAELDFGGSGPRAVLQAHMDTVGVDDMSIEPFSGEIRAGKIWGRGTTDCKGGLAAAVTALRVLSEFRADLHGSVVFQSVVEEECSGSGAGAMACCARGLQADFAIITDGSGPTIWRGYSGCLTVDLTVRGRSGHAARPGGVSAIEKALVIKKALDEFKREREAASDKARVNLGIFRAGIHPAVVPGEALLSLNLCYPLADAQAAEAAGEGFNGKLVREQFEAQVRAQEQADDWLREHPVEVFWVKDLIPFETPAAHPLVQSLAAMHRRILGEEPEILVSEAWSDACYLPHFCDIPTVVYGAGTPGQAHGPAEYAEIERILNCTKVLTAYLYEQLAG